MKSSVLISFRVDARAVRARLTPEFAFLGGALQDSDWSGERTARAEAPLAPEQWDDMVAWARQELRGRTLARAIRRTDIWEAADLAGRTVVEMTLSRDPIVPDPCDITNFAGAFEARWICAVCRRKTLRQVADLAVEKRCLRKSDFQQTQTFNEWFVSARLQGLLAEFGLQTRPIKGRDDYVQLQVEQTVPVRDDLPPIIRDIPCPGCGLWQGIVRSDILEGDIVNTDFPGLTVQQERPLTLAGSDTDRIVFARSEELFGNYHPYEGEAPNKVGEPIVLESAGYDVSGQYYFFASAELVRRLLAIGATGLAFQPVEIGAG